MDKDKIKYIDETITDIKKFYDRLFKNKKITHKLDKAIAQRLEAIMNILERLKREKIPKDTQENIISLNLSAIYTILEDLISPDLEEFLKIKEKTEVILEF